jgi:predicted alpha/beta hydrolase family esterase
MRQQVLFLQGGGAGAHDADAMLALSLQHALGDHYRVWYPRIPHEEQPAYHAYRAQITASLASLAAPVILVGHSVGGFVLVRFLSEEPSTCQVAGLFLIAAPYVGKGGWQDAHYEMPDNLAARLPAGVPIHCYHSRDDEIVPFAHLALYAQRLPLAVIREVDGGHQLNNDLSAVARDIKHL